MARIYFLLIFISFFYSCSNESQKKSDGLDSILYNKAYDLEYIEHKSDTAFLYFNRAKDLYLERKDSLGVAKCYMNMGMISTDKGDYFGGQEFSLNATSYYDPSKRKHHPYIVSNYNNLGLATQQLSDFPKAIEFYQKALKFTTNADTAAIAKINIGNTYRRLKKLSLTIKIYSEILSQKVSDNIYAKTLSNLAFAKWLQNSNYNAAPELLKALGLRLKIGDNTELNASYAHLSDFYAQKLPDSALIYADKMFQVAKKINSADDQMQALQKLIALSNLNDVKAYFGLFRNLDDSVQTARGKARNQFAIIRYDVEKNKENLLIAQAENAEKQNSILKRNIVVIVLGFILLAGYLFYRRRKKRLQQEKELEVKNTELKYTKKVHDHVANKVYHIMSEVEYSDILDKEKLLDKLDIVYNISRDISYEGKENNEKQFAKKLSEMLNSYPPVQVSIGGNDEALWSNVKEICKSEVFYVLQELMTNAKKHSEGNWVSLGFNREKSVIHIQYSDNGNGMKVISPKNGLKNTETRIQNIFGSITFDNEAGRGLKIHISFPIT